MKHGSLFSGIGGFDLAAEWAGWENMFHCEWNPFGQKVLKHYWPNAATYEDITKTDFTIWRGRIEILTGGFPCQPYSAAGKRLGKEDERHLWPEMLRTIREIQPRWVVGENVLGLVNWNGGLVFEEVQADLEAEGYEVQPFILPAASVNAPHKRDRVWFVAYSDKSSAEYAIQTGWNMFASKNGNGIAADTDHNGYATAENGQGLGEGNDRNKTGQDDAIEFEGRAVSDGVATYSDNKGRSCGSGQVQETNGEIPKRDNDAKPCNTNNGNATDTNGANNKAQPQKRILGEEDEGRKTGRFEYGNTRTMWDEFPTTEPTIRSGNDGLSSRLDGITFSKWRNESIKAGGNAIVPQVVYQIFKAINEYENLHTNRNNP